MPEVRALLRVVGSENAGYIVLFVVDIYNTGDNHKCNIGQDVVAWSTQRCERLLCIDDSGSDNVHGPELFGPSRPVHFLTWAGPARWHFGRTQHPAHVADFIASGLLKSAKPDCNAVMKQTNVGWTSQSAVNLLKVRCTLWAGFRKTRGFLKTQPTGFLGFYCCIALMGFQCFRGFLNGMRYINPRFTYLLTFRIFIWTSSWEACWLI